ncbi:MAG: glycosyltransferase family 2 protein [Chloroflexi bacterium]|nr:glycosyltransferase family 2 protein [Chloroflexota bacterium]
MSEPPLVTVIIVFWNSEKHFPECLERLATQTFRDFEIVVVNNGSDIHWFDQYNIDGLRVHHLEANLGFAVANNIGARLVRGKWIALLNADAYPEPDWLENLLKAARENPQFNFFSSRQLQADTPELLDGAGDAYHISGLAWRNGYCLPADSCALEQREVFSPCAAAALYSRDDFIKIGGFDEDYFSYFEDVDLGFRLGLQGKKCLYVPEAVVHHVGSASTGKRSDFSVYYGYRNLIWTFVKDMPSPLLWLFLPLHIAAMSFFMAYLTLRGQGRAIWKAVFDALRGLPKVIEKRRAIQKDRRIRSSDLLKVMSTGILEPYREFMERNKNR